MKWEGTISFTVETDPTKTQEDVETMIINAWLKGIEKGEINFEECDSDYYYDDMNELVITKVKEALNKYDSENIDVIINEVVYYTFDPETCVYLFDTNEEACDYLQKMWQYCFNSEIATNESEIDFEMTYHEEDYAQIKWNGNDNPMRIWQVTTVSEPMKIS